MLRLLYEFKDPASLNLFLQIVGDVLVDTVKHKEQIRTEPATPIIKPYKKWLTEYQAYLNNTNLNLSSVFY